MNYNTLNKSQYLITKELQEALQQELNITNKVISTNKSGIYIVAVRVLSNKDKTLIYNYMYYPDIFINVFLDFLLSKNQNSSRFNEWGDLFVVLDKNIYYNYPIVDEDFIHNLDTNRFLLNKGDFRSFFLNELDSYFRTFDSISILNLINKLNFIVKDDQEMVTLLKYSVEKDYSNFTKSILDDMFDYVSDRFSTSLENYNLINTTLFVVKDLNSFINTVPNTGFTINGGPQKWRSQVNSMNGVLVNFDQDFRKSLYNHNQHHIKSGNIDKRFELSKNKFSFNNIHMNLGNVRWYSTKIDRVNMTKKLLERLETKNQFKAESEVFIHLSRYLKHSPVNEQTELNIENFLLNYHNSNKQTDKSLIKFDLFSDKRIKNFILDSISILTDFLKNFRNKEITLTKKSSQNLISRYHLFTMLKYLEDSIIIEICIGMIARIISNYNKPNDECISLNILNDIGDIIIKSYIYILYKKDYINLINTFIIKYKEYLNNHDLDIDIKNNIDKIISNIEKNHNKLEVFEIRRLFKSLSIYNFVYDLDFDLIINYTLSSWKLDNKDIISLYEENSSKKSGIGAIIVDWLLEANLIQQNVIVLSVKDKRNYLIPSNNILELLKSKTNNTSMSLPLRIPMIVPPKPYYRVVINNTVREKLGGYLINDEKVTDSMIIPNWELKQSSIIQDPNTVYNLVNNVNSVGFKINKDMLDFIYSYSDNLDLLLNSKINFDLNKSKITKTEYSELESFVSQIDLQDNILGLAEVFSNVNEFYLPVRIDYRGRMNCVSQYLNYQSTELAKSLLLFSKGEKLYKNDTIAINYFKAYGANCFGNKLDKKSWLDRSKWIDTNEKDIINYTNGILINKAENKLLFIAFCIEYNKWIKCYNNIESSYFITHLPIQLDATCNGYQHLSLLISDYDMAKELNLTKSTKEDIPKDYYSFMLIKLTDLFKYKIKQNNLLSQDLDCYKRLSTLLLKRSTIKKAIMTVPYNVSSLQMVKYIKENFIKIKESNNKPWSVYNLEYKYKEDSNLILSHKDISLIAQGIREVLETNFPKLKLLVLYLKTIAKICNKLNLTIPWGTSSGILVNQSYTSSKQIKLRPFSYDKSSFSLNVSTGKLNGSKQIRAFMPNLIHSLDAAALALLAEYHFNSEYKENNFYAIHDCFAVTANNVDMLIKYLKLVYIKIYSEDTYLIKLDQEILHHIKYHYGEDCYNPETGVITIESNDIQIKEKYPNINYVIGTQLPTPDLIKESSYLIN